MTEKFSVVATASGKLEGEILRGMLEAQGVDAMLSYESASTAYGLGVGRLARVQIMVREEQVEVALSILEDYRSGKFAQDE